MFRLLLALSFSILLSTLLYSQNLIDTIFKDEIFGNALISTHKDTKLKEFHFHGGYLLIDSLNRVIIDGNKSGDCGCEAIENGFWIYYYPDGSIREQGSYDCGDKVGTWIEFHKNGKIKMVSEYRKPYSKSFFLEFKELLNLRQDSSMRDGQCLEYYDNGQIKTSGQYTLLHSKTTTDSIITIDPDTYEASYTKINGEFWLPRSIKSGTWKYYNSNGEITHIVNYRRDEEITRDIDIKYWEVINLKD